MKHMSKASYLQHSRPSTKQMTVCTLYSVNILSISLCSFSVVGGPREGGRTRRDMNGAFISGGTGSGERERR